MTSSVSLASVIVPVRNAAEVIAEQLDALGDQTVADHLEVVVVDDASRDGTASVVRAWIESYGNPRWQLIERRRRGGPNAARNDGVRATTGRWVLFVDGDDRADRTWAEGLIAALHDSVIVGGYLERLGSGPDDPDRWILRDTFHYGGWPFAPGGNMGVARSLLMVLDGFDENLRAGGTETDLAIRAQRLGATVTATSEAVVAYRVPDRAGDVFAREFRRERGRAYMARRLGVGTVSWRGLVLRWIQLGSTLARYVRRNDDAGALAVALARACGGPIWRLRFWFHLPRFRGLSPT